MKKIFLSIIVLFIISCDDQIDSTVDLSNLEPTSDTLTYALVYNRFLQPNCAGCHGGSGGWDLPTDKAGLIDVNSIKSGFGDEIYVIPSDAENSYLIKRLEGREGIDVMPNTGMLDQSIIDSVRLWIDQGAN